MYLDIQENFIDDFSCSLEKENIFSAKASQIISTLAWAMKCDVPLGAALLTLRTRNYDENSPNVTLWEKRKNWNRDLTRAADALDHGFPVSEALKFLKLYFPPYLLSALAEAENNNALAKVLPVASHQLRFSSGVLKERFLSFIFPISFFMLIIFFVSWQCIFILPRFKRILAEMCDGMPLPDLTYLLVTVTDIAAPFMLLVPLMLPFLFAFLILYRVEPYFKAFSDFFFLKLPVVGKDFKRMALIDLTASMACLTAAGYDVISAAEISKESLRSYWLKKRIKVFVEKTKKGTNWIDAWDEMKLGFPLYNWIARNSASQEKLAEGFMLITKWLKSDISTFSTFFIKVIHIMGYIFNASLVALTVLGTGQALFNITTILAGNILR